MRKLITLMTLTSGIALASPALAVTFDVVAGYNTAPFTYGSGTGGATFASFSANYAGGCQGQAAFTCRADVSPFNLPAVGKNIGATTINFATVTLPNNVVYLHPGSIAGQDAMLRFTAAAADTYTLNGNFIRLDSTPTPNGGDGILASIFKVSGLTYTSLYSDVLVGSLNSSIGFTGLSTTLAAGDHLEFVVNRRTAFNTDSTGLKATITTGVVQGAVPEPSTWAMMLFGFGLIGSTLRRRTATGVSATV